MAAGRLKDRAIFQAEVEAPDGAGGFDLAWQDQFTVPAQLMLGRVSERLEAARLEASGKAVLRIRKSAQALGIAPDWRVIVAGVVYQIRGSPQDPHRKGQWLDLDIEAGAAT